VKSKIIEYKVNSLEVSTDHHGSHDHDEGAHSRHQQHDFEKHVEHDIIGTRSVANLGVTVNSPVDTPEIFPYPLNSHSLYGYKGFSIPNEDHSSIATIRGPPLLG